MAAYGRYVVFLVILILLVIFTFYLVETHSQKTSSSTSTTAKPSGTQKTSPSSSEGPSSPGGSVVSPSNSSTTPTAPPSRTFNVTNTSKSSRLNCLSNKSFVYLYNGNFSTDTFYDWSVSGSGFGNAPFNLSKANSENEYYQNEWSGYNGDLVATTYRQLTMISPGNLSVSFVVVEPYLNFQIISANNKQIYLEIINQSGPVMINHYNTPNGQGIKDISTFAYASINMSSLLCQSVTLKIVANITGATSSSQSQFIAVGNFYQSKTFYQTQGILANTIVSK